MTAPFADVVRSMEIAAAVDIGRLREIMTELVEWPAAVALFCAPIALDTMLFVRV